MQAVLHSMRAWWRLSVKLIRCAECQRNRLHEAQAITMVEAQLALF